MQFSLPTLSALLFLAGQAAAGVTIDFYQGSSGCGGSAIWTRYDTPNNYCLTLSQNALSVKFSGIPSGAKGQAYLGSCSDYKGETTNGCVSGNGGAIRSANWFYPYKRSVPLQKKRQEERFGVHYTLPDGLTPREVEVSPQHLERALKMVQDKDYAGLAEFPDMIGTSSA